MRHGYAIVIAFRIQTVRGLYRNGDIWDLSQMVLFGRLSGDETVPAAWQRRDPGSCQRTLRPTGAHGALPH